MSCEKAKEIDLAAYLVDPDLPEWAEFREHYPTCPDCAEEVAVLNRIEASLRSAADPQQEAHPAAPLLARFEEDPRSLSPADWQRVDTHSRECRQCADELAALRAFDFPALESTTTSSIRSSPSTTKPKRSLASLWAGRGRPRFERNRRLTMCAALGPTTRSTAMAPAPGGVNTKDWFGVSASMRQAVSR